MNSLTKHFIVALLATPFLMTSYVAAQSVDGPASSTVFVTVAQNREISGSIVELNELDVTTSFGEVKVPMAKIDGVKMNVGAGGGAVLAFKNGDMLTGKIVLEKVQLKTDWGVAHVNSDKIETITFDKNARFYADNTSGSSGWRFTKSRPVSNPGSNNQNLMTTPRN